MRPSRIFLLALIAGCMTYISEYESWFALKGYKVEAQSQALEKRLWEIFPQRCLRFWPYLLKDSKGMKEFLERDIPVTVETHMSGFGRFETEIKWLKAWVKVDWRGKIWCISRDGRMWLFEQGAKTESESENLIWKIPEQGNITDDVTVEVPMSGVFQTPLPVEIISLFIEDFRGFNWFKAANEISWERRAGMNLFILKLSTGTQKIELFLQPEKYSGQDVGATIDELFSRLVNEGGDHIIDATYDKKIMVRSL